MTDVQVRSEPAVYRPDSTHSFFADLARAQVYRDENARERLQRHQRAVGDLERRINPNTTDGTGGEFSPPLWLIEQFKTASRAGRTFADLLPTQVLPDGVQSVHVPKIGGGFVDDIQPAQGDVDPSADITTTDVSTSQVVTISGDADVSQQLMDLTPIGFDRAAYLDMARDYNAKLDNSLINGSGNNGQLLGLANFSIPTANTVSGSGITTIATLWPALGQTAAAVGNSRLLQPEVWLMAPRRWFWIASSVDSSNRPIASPHSGSDAPHFPAAGGYPPIGNVVGLPVYAAGAIAGGTSADNVYAVRPSDMILFESRERFRVVTQALSGTLQVRIQLRRYVAFIGNTYTNGLGVLKALPQPTNF